MTPYWAHTLMWGAITSIPVWCVTPPPHGTACSFMSGADCRPHVGGRLMDSIRLNQTIGLRKRALAKKAREAKGQ